MVCETYSRCSSPIHSTGAEARIVAAAVLGVLIAVSSEPPAALAGMGFGAAFAAAAKTPLLPLVKRLAALNAVMAVLAAVFTLAPAGAASPAGPGASYAGLARAGHIALKANAVLLVVTALVSTMNAAEMGHALQNLKTPKKLARLLFFSVRYVDLLHHEYIRLHRAMKARCFRPGMNVRTYKTTGYMLGMLFVKTLDRSERILAAMKCRGFNGSFPAFVRSKPGTGDKCFILACSAVFLIITGFEWIW